MPVSDKIIRTRHADICVSESAGQGFPIVMIHGSGASRGVFAQQMESLVGRSHRAIALDLPGHGDSSDAWIPAETYTVKGFASVVGEVLDRLGIERAAVFGWSLGGHIGIELLSWHPAVAGLMITGAPPVSRGPLGMLRGFQTHRDVFLASKPQFTEAEARRFWSTCYGAAGTEAFLASIRRADGRARKILFNGMMRGIGADQKRTVERAEVPIAVVNGAEESFARLNFVASVAYGNLWEGTCHIIDGAGHAPFWQKPKEFNALLSRFVADVAAGEAARDASGVVRLAQSA
jgi:pimeloyl-ACP methyl ester carboxylesterase